jgi:hypothetical protein
MPEADEVEETGVQFVFTAGLGVGVGVKDWLGNIICIAMDTNFQKRATL